MKKIDLDSISFPRGKHYKKYRSYCHLFDDARLDRSYYNEDSDDEPEYDNSQTVYERLLETLYRGLNPRHR